jgi:hypothetical protein
MRRIILINGLIAGVIVSAMLLISHPLLEKGVLNFDNGMLVGYASMVIALSMIFFGIKSYRDQYQHGSITFGQGFRVGILIALIASVVYMVTWEVYYNVTDGRFNKQYTEYYIDKMKSEGATQEEISKAQEEMDAWSQMYDNMFIRLAMTLMEIFPVGLIITLIAAAVLRKKQVLPAA